MKHRQIETLCREQIAEAIAGTPMDHFVVWTGHPCGGQTGSLRLRALSLVAEPWEPVQLRALMQRASAISEEGGLDPTSVRKAVRLHQSAKPCAYVLVRRTPAGDYVTVADIPWPAMARQPLRAGQTLLARDGRRILEAGIAA